MSKLKVVYQWRELTEDGLLKLPQSKGPYYNEIHLNGIWDSGTYDTKEDAHQSLIEYIGKDRLAVDFVLVELYRYDEGES